MPCWPSYTSCRGCAVQYEALARPSVTLPRRLASRELLSLLLLGAVLWSLLAVDWSKDLLHPGGLAAIGQIFGAMVRPDLRPELLGDAVIAAWRTVVYAITGMTLALAIGFPLGVVASGSLVRDRRLRLGSMVGIRGLLAFFRSIHELVWAWLFVAALGLSPMAAVLALGVPYAGILGRIYAELLQDVPEAPLVALRGTGASEWKVFWYGRLPMALPEMVSYGFYRFECGIRSAAILSWVGLGGLGYQIQISLADLAYTRAWTFIWALVLLVILVDTWSSLIRRRLNV
jgi:phosphonate transport system permease protein